MIWLVYLLVSIGIAFQALGVLALYRFPDVYTRLHGTTMCTTFGSMFVYAGIMLYGAMAMLSGSLEYLALLVRAFMVMALVAATNSVGSHAIARAAHRSGVVPAKAVVDMLRDRR